MKRSFLVCSLLSLLALPSAAADLRVQLEPVRLSEAPFQGFGVQWSAYPWCDPTDAEWERVFRHLDFLEVPLVRCMLRAYWYCEGYDSKWRPVYNWETARMKKLYRLLDYCERRKVPVMIGEWDDPASDEDRQDPAADKLQKYNIEETDPRWPVMICDFLEHLTVTRGYTCLKYYNLINEPNGGWSGCADFDKWKTGILLLDAEMKKRGLHKKIGIAGPDATFQKDHYWVELSVRDLHSQLAAYEVHEYAPISDVESGWLEKHFAFKNHHVRRYDPQGKTKPFFMGEVGMGSRGPVEPRGGEDSHPRIHDHIYGVWMTDYLVQCQRAGMDGAVAWMLDDAMHIMKDKQSTWPDLSKVLWKKWGFFNTMAEQLGFPEDAKLRPWYHSWAMMSRAFPPGSVFLKSNYGWANGFRATAADIPGGGRSYVLVNNSGETHGATLVDPNPPAAAVWSRFDFVENRVKVNAAGYPLVSWSGPAPDLKQGVRYEMPPRSVIILSTRAIGAEP